MPIDAPEAPYFGIRIIFRIKSTVAPASTEYNVIFPFSIATNICNPIILVIPINNTVGIIICIGTTALVNAGPDTRCMLSSAKKIK